MEIFVIKIKDAKNIQEEFLLSFKKKSFSNIKKLKTHCLAYLMTDKILKEHYNIQDRTIVFDKGKPLLQSQQKHFSISHSGEYISIAFSDFPCGVDIEKNKKRNFKDIAKRMNFKSCKIEDFYPQWTEYEACYKLNTKPASGKTYQLDEYTLTALSAKPNESFTLYLDSTEN